MRDVKVFLSSGQLVFKCSDFRGNLASFLKRRNLWSPGTVVEVDGRRSVVGVNPDYGRPGPLMLAYDENKKRVIVEAPEGKETGLLVPAGKFLGEHYGHTPLTFLDESPKGEQKKPAAK